MYRIEKRVTALIIATICTEWTLYCIVQWILHFSLKPVGNGRISAFEMFLLCFSAVIIYLLYNYFTDNSSRLPISKIEYKV